MSLLEHYLNEDLDSSYPDMAVHSLVQFVITQLPLVQVPKERWRYSSTVIKLSFLWYITSTSPYKKLRDLFILPSITRLRQLSQGTTVDSSDINLNYLHQRTAQLNDKEKIVTLIIDEVYTAQRMEYSNGAFIGLTLDGEPAKTVLTFMVQSTCCKYKDIVCLVPAAKLSTRLLWYWFDRVMFALKDLVLVICVSVDNHIINQ